MHVNESDLFSKRRCFKLVSIKTLAKLKNENKNRVPQVDGLKIVLENKDH